MPFDLATSLAAGSTTPTYIPPSLGGGRVRVAMAEFTCATDGTGAYTAPIVLPKGSRVICGFMNSSATMGASATIAIGTAASAGKYRAAATYTTGDTFTLLGLSAVVGEELTAAEQIIMTVAVAALPASGKLVIGFFYSLD
jgi:hypothetical protein